MSKIRSKTASVTEQELARSDELDDICEGLGQDSKFILPRYFYDARGSQLFDQICDLPEYYLTRTELAIMAAHVRDIAALIGPAASLIEFGSGSSNKIRLLLDHLDTLAAYVPVDISGDHLLGAAQDIARDYPDVEVLPVVADFTYPFDLPAPRVMPLRNIVYFPGSTIGNFSSAAAGELLRVMHHEAGPDGGLLIGIDLQKDRATLERAYNDTAGVTSAFNLNALRHLNREFGADFDLHSYRHEALYNDVDGRIEMYLVSLRDQLVHVGGQRFTVAAGERILTEHSHKYTLQGFSEMAGQAGFSLEQHWTDDKNRFAVCFFARNSDAL